MDHKSLIEEGLLAKKKRKLEQLVVKNDRLVKEMMVRLSRYSDDDIRSIDTTVVLQIAQELHENQILAQAYDKEIKEAERGGS